MGTLVSVSLEPTHMESDELIAGAFHIAENLTQVFSKFDPESEVSLYNLNPKQYRAKSPSFQQLLTFSKNLQAESCDAFYPYNGQSLDLSGVAKGFIADKMAEFITSKAPEARGLINAGGDLRFFGPQTDRPNSVRIKVWSHKRKCLRQIESDFAAVATSSPSESEYNEDSSTVYFHKLRPGLSVECTVTVLADDCCTADGLTKVALFADPMVIDHCARIHHAHVLVFDETGQLQESYK